jgi:hypothetical protein
LKKGCASTASGSWRSAAGGQANIARMSRP